ncbi:methyltransferase domain-containing protein [Kroppenstedtia pulmonis]|uniref:Methyltransferase domain-containing protein n=1 Tax=Kroppenstedtia pulmonis TaxID=1380685 RepID=A0A7D3XRP1_9BACL|nr:methyltransferase domain-containing protein [Kroppenstedtia pulmonis]QKG84408.1 methyltransferase domain-containing protein [Kroppenstedtia pulmonis]
MNNQTNRLFYRRLAPYYDYVIGNRWFSRVRRRLFSLVSFQPEDRVLLAGVGTGLDIPYIPPEVHLTGIDITPNMLDKARLKAKNRPLNLLPMNAESLSFPDDSFHYVGLNLILSVVEHPDLALSEAIRVLKPEGKLLVFDKFLPSHQETTWKRRILNHLTRRMGTDITRSWEDLSQGLPLETVVDETHLFHYRLLILKKKKISH